MAITRFKNSSILNRGPKYNDFLAGLPFRPVIGTATDGGNGTSVSVAFTGNNPAGAGITYTALSSPGNLTATGTTSPITVTGLTSGTAYTFQVKAGNSLGDSAYSGSSNSVTPVTPTAFESIASASGTGSSNTITFSSIPSTYQFLQIRIMARDTGTGFAQGNLSVGLRFNNDSGNNYVRHRLFGNGASVATNVDTGISNIYNVCDMTTDAVAADILGVGIVDIHDYASTTTNKTVRSFTGSNSNNTSTTFQAALNSGLWINTAAVNRIDLINVYNNFTSNSRFALYGIKGA